MEKAGFEALHHMQPAAVCRPEVRPIDDLPRAIGGA
jgi:hypothetical protein